MATIRTLRFTSDVDLAGFVRGLDQMEALADDVARGVGARLAAIKPPPLDAGPSGGAGAAAGEAGSELAGVAEAILPLTSQIQSGMQGALAPVAATINKLAAQFEAMAGTVIATNRRLDGDIKFENTQRTLGKLRQFVQGKFEEMEGGPRKWAERADKVLGGGAWLHKFWGQVSTLGSFDKKAAREMGRIKAPALDMGPMVAKLTGVAPMMTGVAKATDAASSSFKSFGIQALAALGFVGLGYKAVGFLASGIKAASDLNETLNLTKVLMGDAAGGVITFADDLAAQFGLVKADTLGVANSIAGLGKGLGKLSGAELTKFTTQLTELAANTTSIKNIDLKAVGDAMRTGLSGEQSDVLKGLGVVITEATVKAYALSHGIGKVGEELTEQQKVMARAGIITEKLSFANGDLANTINDPANAYRKLTGSITNLGAEVGMALMPAVKVALGIANGLVGRLSGAFNAARPAIEGVGLYLADSFRTVAAVVAHIAGPIREFWGSFAGAARGGLGALAGWLPSIGSVADALKGFYVTATMGLEGLIAGVRDFPAWFDRAFGSGPATLLATLAGWIQGALVGGLEIAGFAVRNMGDLFQLAMLRAGQGVDLLIRNFALIPENLGRIGSWLGGNWLDLMLAPIRTVGRAIAALASSFWEFLKHPTAGIKFDLDGIAAEFRGLAAKLPEMAVAQALDVSAEVKARNESIGSTEAAYGARKGPGFEVPRPTPGEAGANAGADAAAVARAAAEVAKAAAPDVTEELSKYAKELSEKTKSPVAKFAEGMDKARQALAAKLIDPDTFRKAEAFNRKEAGLDEMKFAKASDFSSSEAYSTLVSAFFGRGNSDAAKTAQASLKAQQDALGELRSIGKQLGAPAPVKKVQVA